MIERNKNKRAVPNFNRKHPAYTRPLLSDLGKQHDMSRSTSTPTPTQNRASNIPPKAHDIWEMAMIADSFPTSPKMLMFQCRRNVDEGKGCGREGNEDGGGQRHGKISLTTPTATTNNDIR